MDEWKKATDSEYNLDLVKLLEGKNLVGNKLVFQVKYDKDGIVERYKARL